ncbi:hypothetical protein Tco_0742787 [Tanacetum coccineum]
MVNLTFADSHNMVAYMEKSEDNANFAEIVDFLNASPIRYAVTISTTIYVSYIEQFWSTAKIKTVNNETQIRAKVDGKTIVITESSVRRDLHFDDEDDITCLTNTEIFENLQLMGYKKLSDKLTFLKPFFSPQWKYLIHTILQCLSSKSTAWNEFGTNIASTVICLAKNQKLIFSKLIFNGMLRNLDPNSKRFLMYPRFLQLFLNNQIESLAAVFNDEYDTPSHTKKVFANMRRKIKDFSGTVTPLFPSMLASQSVEGEGLGQPTEPQHTPTTASPSHSSKPTNLDADEVVHEEKGDSVERAATSLDAEQDSGNINRTQSTTIPNVPFPQGNGSYGSPRCQEAIGDTIAQTRFERVFTPSYDSPILGFNIPGSDEERIKLKELMDMCTKLSDRVLDLENIKDAQALEIKKLKKRVKKLERKNKSRTPQPKRRVYKPRVESSKESLGEKDASKQGRNSNKTEELNVDEDEHMFELSDLASTEIIADQEETIKLVEDKGSVEKGVGTAEDKDSTADPVTTGGETVTTVVDVSVADDVTLAETLMAIRSSALRPQKLKGVVFKELSEPTKITTSRPHPQIPSKDKGKGIVQEPVKPVKVKGKYQIEYDADIAQRLQAELDEEARLEREREEEASNVALIEEWDSIEARIDADAQLAERLQVEEREHMSVEDQARLLMEFIAARKKFFSAKRAEEQRNKPPTKSEQRKKMCTYMKHMAGYKDKNFKGKRFAAIKHISKKKAESSKKRTRAVLDEENVKRQKVEDDAEKAELKACLEIVPGDDSAVNIEYLATKYPIVDWKTHILAEDIVYYQITRVDGSTKHYKLFSAMLDDFDRQDVLDLYKLVKERFKTTSPEGYDRLLWGDLITLFEPSEEDEIWKTQQDYTLISWKLYDSCGVHLLLMDTGSSIHMLVEKKYPLTQEMLSRMLSGKL